MSLRSRRMLDALQDFRKLDRESDTFADLFGAPGIGFATVQAVKLAKQQVEVVGDEPMSELRIDSRACEIVIGDQGRLAHLGGPALPVRDAIRLRLPPG